MTKSAAYGAGAGNLATLASNATGLSPLVILSQWYAENGSQALHATDWGYFNYPNNPGNVSAEVGSTANKLSVNPQQTNGILTFATQSLGEQAYVANLTSGAYANVLATAGQNYQTELNAIASSPWDGGSPTDPTGHYGKTASNPSGFLSSDYSLVSGDYNNSFSGGTQVAVNTATTISQATYKPLVSTALSKTLSNWDSAMTIAPLSIGSTFSGAFLNDPRAIILRALFYIIGVILIIFAILSFVDKHSDDVASIASSIAPLVA